jgi:hypothetical protein
MKNYENPTHIPVLQILIIEMIFRNVEGLNNNNNNNNTIYEEKY